MKPIIHKTTWFYVGLYIILLLLLHHQLPSASSSHLQHLIWMSLVFVYSSIILILSLDHLYIWYKSPLLDVRSLFFIVIAS